jgi:hypothetical protein
MEPELKNLKMEVKYVSFEVWCYSYFTHAFLTYGMVEISNNISDQCIKSFSYTIICSYVLYKLWFKPINQKIYIGNE